MKMKNVILGLWVLLVVTSCSKKPSHCVMGTDSIGLSPDVCGVVIPPNICPLNFAIVDTLVGEVEASAVRLFGEKGDTIWVYGKQVVSFPEKKWNHLLAQNKGKSLFMDVFTLKNGSWTQHPRIENKVAQQKIDPYLVYRLISGGYESIGINEIVERNLESFQERVLVGNSELQNNCLNCHSFNAGNPNTMSLHVRFANSGTLLYKNGKLTKVQTATPQLKITSTYGSWHPSGKYIASSHNGVMPSSYWGHRDAMEAYDTTSNLTIYDVRSNTLLTAPVLKTEEWNETHPWWSADGKELYFARTKKRNLFDSSNKEDMVDALTNIKYDLYKISFDDGGGVLDSFKFGEPELVLSSEETGKSISTLRVSPNGRFLMFCMHGQGTFAGWHRDADLYIIDLITKKYWPCEGLNGPDADSYHSWSQNGHWVAFASKRDDGFYTRIYIGYVDANGKTYKPFVLPQKNPLLYKEQLLIYNVPELIIGKIPLSPYQLNCEIRKEPKAVKYKFVGGIDSNALDGVSGATSGKEWNDRGSFQ